MVSQHAAPAVGEFLLVKEEPIARLALASIDLREEPV
jgi:hypothetical protein